jgi:glycosyltransferase involved in cell wall biosynthesis
MNTTGYDRGLATRPSRPVTLARFALDEAAVTAAEAVLERTKVAIFIVAFQAEHFIASVLDRIPPRLRNLFAEILVIDDSSSDLTFETARLAAERLGFRNVTVLRTPFRPAATEAPKLGYLHAIKQGFDYVVLLHGDGQYAPEYLPQIVNALGRGRAGRADRFADDQSTRRAAGGMPVYKWVEIRS